ncbi:hypothetical protein [uncultured Cytophaga sp.]|uniref:hypothetical protein n=1 Tax=uncultured Cytophaga sp. TaxID=160238 RepID=UPI00260406AB|nr:hypothetical protein [uncultured Cytophaga sp.]
MNKHPFLNKKSLSIFLLLVILITVIIVSIGQYNKKINRHHVSSSEDTVDVVATYAVDLNEESGNYEEDYEREEEISTYSLASLWDKPEEDKKNIEDVMLYVIDNILYTTSEGNFEDTRWSLSYITSLGTRRDDELSKSEIDLIRYNDSLKINNYIKIREVIDTDPNKLKPIFNSYKQVFYSLMPKRMYVKTDLENIVNILVLSYKDLNANNKEEKCSNLYDFLNEHYYYNLNEEIMKEYISDTYRSEYKKIYYADGSRVKNRDLYCIYSFWARRYHEKNIKDVYDILIEIQNHYSE